MSMMRPGYKINSHIYTRSSYNSRVAWMQMQKFNKLHNGEMRIFNTTHYKSEPEERINNRKRARIAPGYRLQLRIQLKWYLSILFDSLKSLLGSLHKIIDSISFFFYLSFVFAFGLLLLLLLCVRFSLFVLAGRVKYAFE